MNTYFNLLENICYRDHCYTSSPMRSLKNYTVVLRPDDNETFVAYIPAIAGCHAWGQTTEEAQAELIRVFEMIWDEYQEVGQELLEDVKIAVTHAR